MRRAPGFRARRYIELVERYGCDELAEIVAGVLGGGPGAPSKQRLVRADGTIEDLPSKITNVSIRAGDLIWMSEPGGGYGDPLDREPERVLENLLME